LALARYNHTNPPPSNRISDPPNALVGKEAAGMALASFREYLKVMELIKQHLQQSVMFSYDAGADVLYINFRKGIAADDSEMTDEDVIIRYKGSEVIGYTVLYASQR
jgi:uncharacterized protein YuzE